MSADWRRKLASVAILAPSADNSQPWTFNWDGKELTVAYRQCNQEHSVFSAGSHATLLSAGSAVELIDSALAANSVSADWRWPSNPTIGHPYVSVQFQDSPAGFEAPEGALQRHTNRFPFRRDPLPSALMGGIQQMHEGGNRVVPVTDKERKTRIISLDRICSEARFCTRELLEWLTDSLRYTPREVEVGDGLDVRTLALPPGGSLFMRFISDWRRMRFLNRLGVYKIIAISEVSLLPAAPALICIAGPSGTRGAIDAGRLMTRLWMHLNLNGIAVHPYYVVTDQINRLHEGKVAAGFASKIGEVEKQTRELLKLKPAEMLHILLRVGYPKTQPLRSRRLPLDALFVDNS